MHGFPLFVFTRTSLTGMTRKTADFPLYSPHLLCYNKNPIIQSLLVANIREVQLG